jgi:hypothetical protein
LYEDSHASQANTPENRNFFDEDYAKLMGLGFKREFAFLVLVGWNPHGN